MLNSGTKGCSKALVAQAIRQLEGGHEPSSWNVMARGSIDHGCLLLQNTASLELHTDGDGFGITRIAWRLEQDQEHGRQGVCTPNKTHEQWCAK